jgi:MFS family permease
MANNSGLEEDKEREMPHIAPIDSSKMSGEPQGSGQTHHPEQLDISQPPDGGYGWICVVCVFLINAHTWGLNSSYGVFLAHYLESSAYLGSTDLEFAFVGGLSISQALLLSPIATAAIRVCGTRIVLLIGVFFETLSLIGASHSTQIWQLFLTQGVCFGWGMGFQFVASVGIIPQWFSKRRGLANGIVTSGSGFGGLVYSLAANAMIQNLGLAWTFRMLAILQFTVNFICAILVKDRNMQVKPTQRAFDYRLFKRYEYLLFLGWGFFSMLGYIVVLFSLPNYARSIGLSAKQGSVVGAVLNLGQGLGRPAVGYFSDAAGRINMAALTTFSCGLICFVIWIFAKSYGVLIFFAMLVGTVSGVYWNVCILQSRSASRHSKNRQTVAPIGAEVVGLVDLPSALSITWLVLVFPTSCTYNSYLIHAPFSSVR